MGRAGFPPCFFTWDQIMVEVLKIMVTSFKRPCACTAALSAPDPAAATTDPCLHQRLLDTHGQVWISFLWGHCSFLLGHGTHKVLFVPSKSLFPSGGSVVGLMATSFKNLCHTQVCCIQSPCPCGRPLVTHTSAGDTQTFKGRTDSLYGFSGAHKVLFQPSEHLWQVWGLILNAILPFLPSFWGFSFALDVGYLFWVVTVMVVQQQVVMEFLQEKMSEHPSTAPSCTFTVK